VEKTKQRPPWARGNIGTPVVGRLTTREALRVTGNDWKVAKVSMMSSPKIVYVLDEQTKQPAVDGDGTKIVDRTKSEDTDLFGITNPVQVMTVRVDTREYLGTVGTGYKVVQNDEFCEFFDEALGEGAACINAVGRLGRFGARIFMVAQVPDMLEVVPGDPIERHILLTNTHDGTGNIEARFIAYRPASDSMVHMPGGVVKIRHTKNAKVRLKTAHRVLSANTSYWERAQRAYRYMAKRDVNDQRMREFLEAMFPDIVEYDENGKEIERRTSPHALASRTAVEEIFKSDVLNMTSSDTDWGLFNAVAHYVDHERRQSKKQKEWGISRWEMSVFGTGASVREAAFHWLTKAYK